MARFLLCCVCVVGLSPAGRGQDQDSPTRMTISPAAAPDPALRYRLYPSEAERRPGNAALTYYRCLSPDWFTVRNQPRLYTKVTESLTVPLNKLERKDLNWVLDAKQLKELDLGARQEYCAWEFLQRVRREGFHLLLPEVQAFRQLAACIALRARLQLADGQFGECLYSLQSTFSLGHDVADAPLAINALVGIALANIAMDQVRELIEQPGSPNLYWALATIPRPFVDWPKIMEGEQLWLDAEAPLLHDIEKRRLSGREYAELEQQLLKLTNFERRPGSGEKLELTYLVLKQYPEARSALIGEGRRAEDVDAMSTLQVWAIHALKQFRRLQDDQMKWYYLPADAIGDGPDMAEQEFRTAHRKLEGEPFVAALPAYQRLRSVSLKLERQIALLQVVEAIRLHAASQGSLPATLEAISAVPVPHDPASGKLFAYKVEGAKATLSIPNFQFGKPHDYELTLKK
jgi:hypothetical protein